MSFCSSPRKIIIHFFVVVVSCMVSFSFFFSFFYIFLGLLAEHLGGKGAIREWWKLALRGTGVGVSSGGLPS